METGFGWIRVGHTTHEHDVIIHADGSVTKRSKKRSKALKGEYGHTPLSEEELGFLDGERPERVYIGTGQYGDLPLTPAARQILQAYPARIGPTPEILPELEREKRRYVAILHVTC